MPSRWEAATRSWRRKVLHYPLPTLMYRNFRLPCTIELQPVSLMPLKMRKVQLASQLHGVLMLQSLAIVRQPVGHLVHDVGRYGSAVIHDGWPVEDVEGDLISERVAGVDAFYFVRHQRSLSPLVGFDIPPFSAKSPGGRGNPDSSCTGRTPQPCSCLPNFEDHCMRGGHWRWVTVLLRQCASAVPRGTALASGRRWGIKIVGRSAHQWSILVREPCPYCGKPW